jgi:hypothetical protein
MNNPLSEEEKIIVKRNLIRYVKLLYKFLGDKYCFTSGAFVIQDNEQKLYNMLLSVYDINLSKYHVKSHTDLKNANESLYEIYFPYGTFKQNIICKCSENDKSTIRKMQNIKFYKFTSKNNNIFVYVKIEDYMTKDINHLLQAVDRYIFSKENKSCVIPRREDCNNPKRKNCIINNIYKKTNQDTENINLTSNPLLIESRESINNTDDIKMDIEDGDKENINPNVINNNNIIDVNVDVDIKEEPIPKLQSINTERKLSYDTITINNEKCDTTETYERVGDEFFIPYCVNDFFKNIIENKIEDNYIHFIINKDENTIEIRNMKLQVSTPSNSTGGTKKNKKNFNFRCSQKKRNKKKETKRNKKRIHRTKKRMIHI